jgi:Autoinducer binding domain
MMHRVIQRYLENSEYARSPGQLRDAVSAVIAPLDFHSFAFLALGDPPFLISSHPIAWTGHYIAQGYQACDPVILNSHRVFDLFTWSLGEAEAPICRAEPVRHDR